MTAKINTASTIGQINPSTHRKPFATSTSDGQDLQRHHLESDDRHGVMTAVGP